MYILKENIVVDLKGETQRKVAEKIGITEQTLSKILNKKMSCSKMIAYCIVKINCNFSLKEYEGSDGNIYTKPQVSRFVNSKDNFKKDYVPTVRTINNEFIKYEDYKNRSVNNTNDKSDDVVEIGPDSLPF